MEKHTRETSGLMEEIQRLEIVINSLNNELIEDKGPFKETKTLPTIEEMKKKCAELKERISQMGGLTKKNQEYYIIQNEIINKIVELEGITDYYIENGNLFRIFEKRLEEIEKEAKILQENIEDIGKSEIKLKLLINRYEHYLEYIKKSKIQMDAAKLRTEEAIARNNIEYNIRKNSKRR